MPVTRTTSADISDRILDAATRLFAARGFEGASLQDVADAVGIRKPSLLYHVSSKDALRLRVLEGVLARWNDVLPRLLRAAATGSDQFDAVVKETVHFFAADPDRARLLVREALDRPEEMVELIRSHVAPWVAIVCDYIRKGQEQGRIYPDVDPEAYVAQVINLVISGVATFHCIGVVAPAVAPERRMPDRHIDELLRVAKTSLFLPGAGQE
jgi:TetR/AcrR family transcriptional regulator